MSLWASEFVVNTRLLIFISILIGFFPSMALFLAFSSDYGARGVKISTLEREVSVLYEIYRTCQQL